MLYGTIIVYHKHELNMQINFFTSLFYKISQAFNNFQKSLETEEQRASNNPLYQSFNLYIKEDLKLALDLLHNGYQPTQSQKENLHNSLLNDSKKNTNFLFNYQQYIKFVPKESVISYCLNHDLSDKCTNEKTVFDNFEFLFKYFSQQENFSEELYTQLKNSIFNNSLKVSSFKPRYSHIHAFEFNNEEKRTHALFRANIYNALVLIPYMIKNMDQFVSLRTTIEQSVQKVEKLVQTNNVRIINTQHDVIHYNASNRKMFNLETLHDWVGYIKQYNTSKLQQELIAQVKTQQEELKTFNASNSNTQQSNNDQNFNIEYQINQLKNKVHTNQTEQIERIQALYQQVKNDMFEKKQHHELENLYKDLPQVIEKFISIHPDYRDTLKNVEGKSPEQLMIESLNVIEDKFKLYWENINQDKVTDLSIVGRAIKMKA